MAQASADSDGPIHLAHARPFRLGEVEVYPSTRQIVRDGRSETLEPRVMQVLVALAEARGTVLTRSALSDRCWEGRIVGENAIDRVISRIRQVAAGIGMGSFHLETITKVGYRLIIGDAPPASAVPIEPAVMTGRTPAIGRRLVLGGTVMLAAAGAGAAWLWRGEQPAGSASPLALDMYRRGLEARNQGWSELSDQAQAYFRQAVEADPNFAEAWAALALSYFLPLSREVGDRQQSSAARGRSAAQRALALDPDLVEAQAALVLIPSSFRRWAAVEAGLRRLLDRQPSERFLQWLLRFQLSRVLSEVGRIDESVDWLRQAVALNPYHPDGRSSLSWGYWAAGRLAEADSESERAIARWPKHPAIWLTRMGLLTYSGRPAAALALASDRAGHPFQDDGRIALRSAAARALDSRRSADIERAVAMHLDSVGRSMENVPAATWLFAALGRIDTVFALCRAYFFNAGPYAHSPPEPIGPLTRRSTGFLFLPPFAPVRADPRFPRLTEAVELESYWRSTRSIPDYRR
jgi:DNA-binding winged helix-turn-helix (wHTH) protein/tetratricopeptide (TPR) repeat protein